MADKHDVKTKNTKNSRGNLALSVEKQDEFERKVKSISSKEAVDELVPGVIYLGHIPHGFYENEIREFFTQFGTVNKVRLSRSKKTARSKGYAFVEFDCDEVAKIAAETMDNYMMFGKVLKCKVVPPERVHPRLWNGANRTFKHIPWNELSIKEYNKERNQQEHTKNVENILKRESRKRKQLEKLGISYDFPGYKKKAKETRPKHTRFSD